MQVTFTRHDGGAVRARRWDRSSCRVGGDAAHGRAHRASISCSVCPALVTRARTFVEAAGGGIVILDTRKTTPTLRTLEKYAVRAGGATNHRVGLFDAVLIKDNHVSLAGGVGAAIALARERLPGVPIEVEVQTLAEFDEALASAADSVLVDNMSTEDIREAVRRAHGSTPIEISGGVTLDRLPELAATGADYVSVGALTHSAPAIDISFEIEAF